MRPNWYSPHVGARQQARALRQSYRRCLKLRDEASLMAMAAIHEQAAVEVAPDRDSAAYYLAHVALLDAEARRCTWAEAVAQLLRQIEESAAPGPVAEVSP